MDLLEGKVIGIYNNVTDVNLALNDLHNNGFTDKYVSVLGKDTNSIINPNIVEDSNTEVTNVNYATKDLSMINAGSGATAPDANVRGVNVNNSFDEIRQNNGVEIKNNDITEGAKAGTALGMIGALAVLMIPGIGPVLATGPILAALSAVVGGAVIGSVMSFIKDDRIPNSRADFYTTRFNAGDLIIMIDTDQKFLNAAKVILAKYNPSTIDTF